MVVFSFSGVSCDDDGGGYEDNVITQGDEKVSVEYAGAKIENYQVVKATYTYLYQRVEGSTKIDSNDGVTFQVTFSDGKGYYSYWQFQTRDIIINGVNLSINGIFFGTDYARYTDKAEGDAVVKSVNGKKITLSFHNFKFDRYVEISSDKKQKMTINGDITFTFDE